jgi:hypothetical protein
VLAAAEAAQHANGLAVGIDRNDRVRAIFVARPAVILDGLSGAILGDRRHAASILLRDRRQIVVTWL